VREHSQAGHADREQSAEDNERDEPMRVNDYAKTEHNAGHHGQKELALFGHSQT
jgi:hypothetical protein